MVQQQYEEVHGMDFTLPAAPPLLEPPLSLLDEARTLINLEGMVNRKQQLVEKAASAAEQLPDDIEDLANNQADSLQDTQLDLYEQMVEWEAEIETLDTQLKELQRFEHGFVYLPELSLAEGVTIITEDADPAIANPTQGALKQVGPNQNQFGWCDPFIVVGLDSRSMFGYPNVDMADRVARATRALRAHESWQAEYEWWTGTKVPTNLHLTAGPDSVQTSPHRTLRFPFGLPTAPPGTVLGVAESLTDSLASLDQAIAGASAGVGMIHATSYVIQKWSSVYPFLRDSSGNIRTVNNNVLVPGYGYPGTGPDQTPRTVDDGVTTDGADTLGSATADFTNLDIGMPVEGDGIPDGTVITGVTDDANAIMSQEATADGTGVTVTLPGTGGDNTGQVMQWAYATDFVYHLQGDVMTYPLNLREQSPNLPNYNVAEARAERTHALITNYLLRAAVLVDTSTP
jgi:hypothetical protein